MTAGHRHKAAAFHVTILKSTSHCSGETKIYLAKPGCTWLSSFPRCCVVIFERCWWDGLHRFISTDTNHRLWGWSVTCGPSNWPQETETHLIQLRLSINDGRPQHELNVTVLCSGKSPFLLCTSMAYSTTLVQVSCSKLFTWRKVRALDRFGGRCFAWLIAGLVGWWVCDDKSPLLLILPNGLLAAKSKLS